jgi:hypothetical protein
MKKYFLFITLSLLLFSCSSEKLNFSGNVYLYQSGFENQIIGFTDEIIYFEWNDSLGTDKFTTPYSLKQENDSLITIILQDSLKYLDSKKFQIVLDKSGGFYSLKSHKLYKLTKKQK